jgi:hypothetical protein
MRRLTRPLWLLVSVLVVSGLTGCGALAPTPRLVEIGPGIVVPADELRPVDRCMFEAGFRAEAVHPGRSGSNGAYSWETTTWYTWTAEGPRADFGRMKKCSDTFAPSQEKTVEELREIYNRWVLERQCLRSLGFHPKAPPAFAEFERTWHTGPWMPIDGVPFERLRGEAKERCGLEMID